ncbi:MAG: TIGR00266 family protein [Acidobacteriota bacterium]
MSSWYVAVGQRKEGPLDEASVMEGLAAGRWPKTALAWKEGLPEWAPVSEIAAFKGALAMAGPSMPQIPRAGGRSHEIDFKICGEEMQFVEIELDPGETVIAEAGAMMYQDATIEMDTKMGDGSEADQGLLGKALSAGKRLVTGESLFMTHFTATAQGKSHVAFASPYPGKIIPLDLAGLGGEILCQKDSFLCAAKGTEVGIAFSKRFGAGLFGGEGFILQRLRGDGFGFVHAGGTIVERDLEPGQTLKLDTGCIVAMQPSVDHDIQMVKGVKSLFFGGEGLFLATLTGPGRVWLQSLPFSRLAGRIASAAGPGASKGEGNVLGGFGLGSLIGEE